jgi:hypothetical protein
MHYVFSDTLDIASRIAATENRVDKLRDRIQRLDAEGSDSHSARDLLDILQGNLHQLYARQTTLRRSQWTSFGH